MHYTIFEKSQSAQYSHDLFFSCNGPYFANIRLKYYVGTSCIPNLRFMLDISVSEYLTFSTAVLVIRAPYTNIIHLNNISIYNKF